MVLIITALIVVAIAATVYWWVNFVTYESTDDAFIDARTVPISAQISAAIVESEAFDYLDAPIVRLGGAECPIPYSPVLEKAAVPQVADIVAASRKLARGKI